MLEIKCFWILGRKRGSQVVTYPASKDLCQLYGMVKVQSSHIFILHLPWIICIQIIVTRQWHLKAVEAEVLSYDKFCLLIKKKAQSVPGDRASFYPSGK